MSTVGCFALISSLIQFGRKLTLWSLFFNCLKAWSAWYKAYKNIFMRKINFSHKLHILKRIFMKSFRWNLKEMLLFGCLMCYLYKNLCKISIWRWIDRYEVLKKDFEKAVFCQVWLGHKVRQSNLHCSYSRKMDDFIGLL